MRRIHVASSLCLSIAAFAIPAGIADAGTFQIFATFPTGSVTLDVDAGDSISNVLQKISDKEGVDPADMALNHDGQWLQVWRTVDESGIQALDTLETYFVTEFVDLETGGNLPTTKFNFADATGTAGDGWLHFQSSGGYDLASMDPSLFDLDLTSFDRESDGLKRGDMANFDSDVSYRWKILTAAGGITGFDAELFSIDASGISNTLAGEFSVTLSNDGTTMFLQYNVPGPGAFAAVAGLVAVGRRRRR